jgi:hypothetical protein
MQFVVVFIIGRAIVLIEKGVSRVSSSFEMYVGIGCGQ